MLGKAINKLFIDWDSAYSLDIKSCEKIDDNPEKSSLGPNYIYYIHLDYMASCC